MPVRFYRFPFGFNQKLTEISPFLLLLIISLVYFLQNKSQHSEKNELHQSVDLNAPSDHFAQMRSWPDRTFSPAAMGEMMAKMADLQSAARYSPCDNLTGWTLQGPSNIGGRCNVITENPQNPKSLLAGFATGGIYQSLDAGQTWKDVLPLKFNQSAIADFTFSPSDTNIIWAALGDPNISGYPSTNGGVLKSIDGGKTWKNTSKSTIFTINSRIIAHPTHPNEIWLASMGTPFKRDSNRGIYKSTDGGITWKQQFFVSNQAGAIDLLIHPTNPQIMFCATWDRIRTNQESVNGGINTLIWKSIDGGNNWSKMTNGLPNYTTNRIGLKMSPTNPDKIYAVFADTTSRFLGIWKTINGGDLWSPINTTGLENAFVDFGWYFCKLQIDPVNDEIIFCLGLNTYKRNLQNNSFSVDATAHSDIHDYHIFPNGDRLIASDGGIYTAKVNSQLTTRLPNFPTTQFYHVNWSPLDANRFYGGAQDNGTMRGSSANLNGWANIYGGDGFRTVFHPTNSQIFYCQSQNGAVSSTENNGSNWNYGSSALNSSDRTNWDTPFVISPHSSEVLYGGTYRIYKNSYGTDLFWEPISPDLTDGNIFGARFHTISCLEESKMEADRLAVGTSDGNVWVKKADGDWTNVSAGLPDRYVTAVHWSATVANRLFVSVSGYRLGEVEAKIYRSDDLGATWTDLVNWWQSPPSYYNYFPVNDFLLIPNSADSLIAMATDAGVLFNRRGIFSPIGKNGGPQTPVFDLEFDHIKRRIIAGTWGNGIWTFPLDSIKTTNILLKTASIRVKNPANLPVPNVTANWGTQITDINGLANLPAISCTEHRARVQKLDEPLAGVSMFDAVRLSRHVLNVQPFSQNWEHISGDLNRDKVVTTGDLVELRRLILGIYDDFPNNSSWRFFPKNHIWSGGVPAAEIFADSIEQSVLPNADTTFFEFTGVKIGDLNNDWLPFFSPINDRNQLEIFVENRNFEANETFEVEFSASSGGLASGQFTLKFDEKLLEIQSIEPLFSEASNDFFGTNRLKNGILTGCFELPNAFNISEKIVKIKFLARQKGDLKSALRLIDFPTPSRGFSAQGVESQAVISFRETKLTADWRLFPNPVGTESPVLSTAFSTNSTIDLSCFDAAGRVVFDEKNLRVTDGACRFLEEKELVSGTYFLKIISKNKPPQFLKILKN